MDDASSLIYSALGYNLLCALLNCSTAKYAWDKCKARYAGKNISNILHLVNSLLNLNLKRKQQMKDHIANMETRISMLAAMNDPVCKFRQVLIFVSSLTNPPQHATNTTSIKKMRETKKSWNYLPITFKEER